MLPHISPININLQTVSRIANAQNNDDDNSHDHVDRAGLRLRTEAATGLLLIPQIIYEHG